MNTAATPSEALLGRHHFDAAALFAQHRPVLRHPGKRAVLELAGAGRSPQGSLYVSRYGPVRLPERVPSARTEIEDLPGLMQYRPAPAGPVNWHLNFAGPDLFFAYGSAAFAQDEIQVAEHPVLGSVR